MSTQKFTTFPLIEMRGVIKKYQYQPVLDRLTFTINDGEFSVLVGANGAGKTTLIRIAATLIRPDAGTCLIAGEPAAGNPHIRRTIGYVGHQPMFYQDLTAFENLCHYARLYHLSDAEERAAEGIRLVGLTPHLQKPVRTFSRGMQQRLSIARALLHNPKILLFDEPYTGLDQEAAQFLDQQLTQLHQPGRAILLAAHRPQRLKSIATHIAWLKNGQISEHIAMDRLSETPDLERYLQEAA